MEDARADLSRLRVECVFRPGLEDTPWRATLHRRAWHREECNPSYQAHSQRLEGATHSLATYSGLKLRKLAVLCSALIVLESSARHNLRR
jgi:hypothetical protein